MTACASWNETEGACSRDRSLPLHPRLTDGAMDYSDRMHTDAAMPLVRFIHQEHFYLLLHASDLKEGMLIEGPKWKEPVEVKKVDIMDDGASIIGSLVQSGDYIDAILSGAELASISLKQIDCDFSSAPWKVFLALETIRYRFASMYDPLLAMNTSKIDPLPHQIDAVYGHVLKMPRIRFMLAHDPGAGKTIMTGLIVKEMKLRYLAKRILVVVPGHLKDQWRRELKDKFEETFVTVDRGTTNALYGENVWHKENQIITSMDFAKRDEMIGSLQSAQFDLIVVDEAHKMAAYRYGDKVNKTSRYKLGEILSSNSEHLLFLTATPHKGDNENFRLFLDLLEPGFFATTEMLEESMLRDENTLFLRQIKEDMKDFDGKPLFLPRYVSTPVYDMSDPERDLYRDLTEYVRNQFNRALSSDKKRNIGFALIVLQRRLASSSYALWMSLQRRRDKLSKLLSNFEESRQPALKTFDFDEMDDMDEEARWEQERIWETLSIAENREELKREIDTVGNLADAAKAVIDGEHEVKLTKLKETMEELDRNDVTAKILIFTESRDTLEYLEKRVRSWGYEVSIIRGGMKLEERVNAEGVFRNKSRVMIATEAAGEGINLQFCHLMINYDIPWNPNRLEQRMGRVHRYGQKYEVYVYNLVAQDTIEGRVFRRLFEKLDEIRSKMGNDRVYDIIGEIYQGRDLAQLLSDAAMGARTESEILEDMDITVDDNYIQRIRENLGDTLATKNIDFSQLGDMREKARENRLMPEYTADFFIKAFTRAGGKIRERQGGLHAIDSIPYEIRYIARDDKFKKSFGSMIPSYPKITFSKDVGPKDQDAEFLTFGHPMFEAVLEWISKEFTPALQRGAVFVDRSGQLDGTVMFFEGAIKDGTGRVAGKRLFSRYLHSGTDSAEHIPPSILWDLDDSGGVTADPIDLEAQKTIVKGGIVYELREYQKELLEERERQAGIKERYGIKSLEKMIHDHDRDLLVLREKQREGKNMDIAIRNKEEKQKQYMDRKKTLAELIEQEKSLTVGTPKFLGIVRVVPAGMVPDAMRENAESEQVAMAVAMAFERAHGRKPEDVSRILGLGYDIKSVGEEGIRYIEVKGRHKEGRVALTRNEWFKAKHLAEDYYLYVVWNTKDHKESNLRPLVILDPAHNTNPKTDVHYLIDAEEIRSKAV